MLKKAFRLIRTEDFEEVFRSGKTVYRGDFGCRYRPNGLDKLRLGFSVSRKRIPLAVERNRIRRVFSEAIRIGQRDWLRKGADVIFFVVKKPAALPSFNQAVAVAREAFRKINE